MLPQVASQRAFAGGADGEGGLVRQQAAALCELANQHHLTQQVRQVTREGEILDLIWSSDPDLVSSIQIDPFQSFTDHYIVTASTSYKLEKEVAKERKFLLNSGKRLQGLDFSRYPWADIKGKLREIEWSIMET